MLTLAADVFGNVYVAWAAGLIGLVLVVPTLVERRRLKRQTAQLQDAQEKLADDLWEIKAAGEARSRAEASTQAKSRFLAAVSHEVRTPLNGILGMAELLGATPLDPEQQAYLDAIQASGRALTALIDEVLDLSRIEAGRMDLAIEPFDPRALVEGVVELLGPRAQEKGLEIASFVAPDVPAAMAGDMARLRQILINLAGNAVKFTDRGGVGVRVEASPGGLTFTVADTGPGVPKDRRAAIFEEFEQGDISTLRQHGGTGLGLTIARRLVSRMGGSLTLADRPGGGSVFGFTITLPDVAIEGAGTASVTLPDLRGRTALIVARSPFQAPYLAQTLGRAGAKVTVVASAADALPLLTPAEAPDLLLVDCALGETAMYHMADAAVAAGVGQSFLMFSPSERRAFGQRLVGAFDGWLVKPVRARSLASRLGGDIANRTPVPIAQVKAPDAKAAPAADMRILLAEDNEINTLVMLKMLDRIGADVTHAADGSVALNFALAAMRGETKPFDTILLDISMPGLDGQEAARLLRRAERGAGAPHTRIVALTAYAFDEDRQACFDAGIDEFLTKPIDLARLRAALNPGSMATEVPREGPLQAAE